MIPEKAPYKKMREAYGDTLIELAQKDPALLFVSADCGAHEREFFKNEAKGRLVETGLAEANSAAVAAGLAAQGYTVLLIGGEEERAQVDRFLEPLRVRVCDLTGRLNLRQLAAVLVCCRVLVTNDSGPMHLAAAVGTPTVALFGHGTAGGPRRWGPWGRGHRILHRDALGAIAPADVLAAVDEIVL